MNTETDGYLEPCNIEAEQIILGTILSNNNMYYQVSEVIEYFHFYEPVHQKIYRQIEDLINKGLIANHVTLKSFFRNEPALQEVGQEQYLVKLTSLATLLVDIRSYANAVLNCYLRRQLILLGSEVVQRASNEASDESPQKQIEMIGSDLLKLDKANSNFEYFEDLLNKEIERLEFRKKNPNYIPGIVTGYTDLDKYIDCFKPGQLIILAARPAMGKTAFCLNLMMSCLDNMNMKNQIDDKERQSAGLFSLEMSGEEMVQRVLSIKTEIPRKKYDNNIPLKEDKHIRDVYKAAKALQETPIFIDSEGGSPINKIKNKARILKRKHNLGILFIDYLQLIKGNTRKGDENRTQEITQITQELKALAKELEVPIIALSQLSRNVENRTDKTPHLADLRESGSIEQDADLVMFLYREEYYLNQVKEEDLPAPVLEKKEKVKNQADVIIAKQRDGPVGSFKLYFDSETNKFKNFKKVESWN